MVLEGVFYKKYSTQHISDKFKKRDFVLSYENSPGYNQFIKFEVTQDYCDVLDDFEDGENVSVSFDINGREWANKSTGEVSYFNSLKAWKIQKLSKETQGVVSADIGSIDDSEVDGFEDLPF